MGGTWLTKKEISDLKDDWRSGSFTKRQLADKYGVTTSCVYSHVKEISRAPNPPCEKGEEWRDVFGYEGLYLVSNQGRVYKTPPSPADHYMTCIRADSGGAMTVSLCKDGVRKNMRVNVIVVYAFTDADPSRKIKVTNIDGDASNNRIENLDWSYRPERKNAKRKSGPRKQNKSLTDDEVIEVQARWLDGANLSDLAQEYDVSTTHIFNHIGGLKRDFKFPECEPCEGWREIEGYEGQYLISNHGRIYLTGCGRREPKIAIQTMDKSGYYHVQLNQGHGKGKKYPVHRLVAMAFCEGRTEERNVVNHIDGDKTNNHASNLEWCTNAENVRHAVNVLGVGTGGNNQTLIRVKRIIPRDPNSNPSPFRKFTDDQVREIRSDPRSATKIAEECGVNKSTIVNMRKGKTYKNV